MTHYFWVQCDPFICTENTLNILSDFMLISNGNGIQKIIKLFKLTCSMYAAICHTI